jgi:hypothetical protein
MTAKLSAAVIVSRCSIPSTFLRYPSASTSSIPASTYRTRELYVITKSATTVIVSGLSVPPSIDLDPRKLQPAIQILPRYSPYYLL